MSFHSRKIPDIIEAGTIIIFDELGERITGVVLRKDKFEGADEEDHNFYFFWFSDGIGNTHSHSLSDLRIDKWVKATPLSRLVASLYNV